MSHVKSNQFDNTRSTIVTKHFESIRQFNLELHGYDFFARYYQDIPSRNFTNRASLEIGYQNVGTNNTTVGDALALGKTPNLSALWLALVKINNTNWSRANSAGGTQLFYLDRLPRLLGLKLENLFGSNLPSINNYQASIEPEFLTNIATKIRDLSFGICIPSQGDLHERNIFTNGTIVDFEGAGYNHIATDIATFVWHTIFAGSYFGPQYAKWATSVTSTQITMGPKCFSISGNTINVNVDINRQKLVLQFVDQYINRLNLEDQDKYLDQVCQAIAFRLLTTFNLSKMSVEDQKLSLVFAHLFANKQISFWDKLQYFIKI